MQYEIPLAQRADGVLIPHAIGQGKAVVTISQQPGQPKTAIISFEGVNQALVNFDDSGMHAINYTLFNPMADMRIQLTVEMIINHLSTTGQQAPALLH